MSIRATEFPPQISTKLLQKCQQITHIDRSSSKQTNKWNEPQTEIHSIWRIASTYAGHAPHIKETYKTKTSD